MLINIPVHDKNCKYVLITCCNPECSYQGDIKDYKDHCNSCSFGEYKCLDCNSIINKNGLQFHNCSKEYLIPLRYCSCGERLEWITFDEKCKYDTCYNNSNCVNDYYYKCDKCRMMKCMNHSPVPLTKYCGCQKKLKGGFIGNCSNCDSDQGLGWFCNQCDNGIHLCENCIKKLT